MINFHLPKNLIAQKPATPRDSARLLVYDRFSKTITDAVFSNLNSHLPENTTLVLNNSKVEHCRWLFDDSKLEIFVLDKTDTHTIKALVRPGKKFKKGYKVLLAENIVAEVLDISSDGTRIIKLNLPHDSKELVEFEHVPLPPYIKQDDNLAKEYQTVYAKPLGSKAAPTAGLHFTNELLEKIKTNHDIAEVTLHVGLGTFHPLTDDQLKSGKLHSEFYEIDKINMDIITKAEHITAVGTTSARTIESLDSSMSNARGWTDILIKPGYSFKNTDALITNFHLPGTSLLLLVEAMVGSEKELLKIYRYAIKNKYRFYSFGDAMLIK